MNETSLNKSPLQCPGLAVTTTRARVSSLVDQSSLQVAGRECATVFVVCGSLSGLVDADCTDAPDNWVLLAVGRLLHELVRDRREGVVA